MLTDGQVHNRQEVINCASMSRDNCRVFTFGIGDDVDRKLVDQVATAGRGHSNFVRNGEKNLKAVVVQSLSKASEPSLKDVTFKFGFPEDKLDIEKSEVFRNQLIHKCRIVPEDRFDEFIAEFECSEDPETNQPIQWSISSSQFDKVEDEDTVMAMFKKGATYKLS